MRVRGRSGAWKVTSSCLLSVIAVIATLSVLLTAASAAPQTYPGGADIAPVAVLNDHTVYAVHVSSPGGVLPPNATMGVSIKLSDTGTGGGYSNAPGFTWNPGASRWIHGREFASYDATISTDATGACAGWYYFKCGDENFTGFPAQSGHGAGQAYLAVQIQTLVGGGSYNPAVKPAVDILDAKTHGAWLHNGISTGASGAQTVLALSGDASTCYSSQKSEVNGCDDDDNGTIDDEDYGPAGANGDFRLGLPATTTVDVNIGGSVWSPGRAVSAPADTDIAVGALDQTPPSRPSHLVLSAATGSVSLQWDGSTDSGGSGLSGYTIYRKTGYSYPTTGTGDPALTTALAVPIASVGSGVLSFVDHSVVNGTTYAYFVRAQDSATNYSARSNEATCKPNPTADVSPPVTTITGIPASGISGGPVQFSLEATDAGSGVASTHYQLDAGSDSLYVAPVTVSAVGTHSVDYWSVDASGNAEVPQQAVFRIVEGAPSTTISGIPVDWQRTPVTFSLSATGDAPPISTYYEIDQDAPSLYSAPVIVNNGLKIITYWSVDSLGRTEVPKTAQIRIDSGNPKTSILGLPPGGIAPFGTEVTFSLVATDSRSGVSGTYYKLDSDPATTTYVAPVPVSGSGTHTVTYWSSDVAGNIEDQQIATFRISDPINDSTPPVTTSTSASTYDTMPVGIRLESTDDNSGLKAIHYKLDNAAEVVVSSPTPTERSFATTVAVSGDGSHALEFWSEDFMGNLETHQTVHFTIEIPSLEATRIGGPDRFETASMVARSKFDTGACDSVVVATGRNFPDALCAGGLAGALHAPVLLTEASDVVPACTLAEAKRVTEGALDPKVYIVGGTTVVSDGAAECFSAAGFTIVRLAGADRYGTAASVADRIRAIKGSSFSKRAFVVRGDTFPDALAAGPFAYAEGIPILLTGTSTLPETTKSAITRNGIADVVIAGSQTAVSDSVANAIGALAGVNKPVREAGADRYGTAATVASYGLSQGWATAGYVGVASGANFPDALAGAPVCGEAGGVLLLTNPSALSVPTAGFIATHKGELAECAVYGSAAAVQEPVRLAINDLLK